MLSVPDRYLTLKNSGGTTVASLTLSTPISNPVFTLADDGMAGQKLGCNA